MQAEDDGSLAFRWASTAVFSSPSPLAQSKQAAGRGAEGRTGSRSQVSRHVRCHGDHLRRRFRYGRLRVPSTRRYRWPSSPGGQPAKLIGYVCTAFGSAAAGSGRWRLHLAAARQFFIKPVKASNDSNNDALRKRTPLDATRLFRKGKLRSDDQPPSHTAHRCTPWRIIIAYSTVSPQQCWTECLSNH